MDLFVKLPMDLARLALAPVRVGTNLSMNAADAIFGMLEDQPIPDTSNRTTEESDNSNNTIYQYAHSNLNIASMIYFYTELRSSVRKLIKAFCIEKNLSYEVRTSTAPPSDILVLWNAVQFMNEKHSILKQPTDTFSAKVVKEYQDSLEQLQSLRKRMKLTNGDLEILKTVRYFECRVGVDSRFVSSKVWCVFVSL